MDLTGYKKSDLTGLSPKDLTDKGRCPTCFNKFSGGAIYGDDSDSLFYRDTEIECFLAKNPRAVGHACISSVAHYQDMSEAPDALNEKMVRYAKALMNIIRELYGCERVYLCTMCDGPANHYHIQLIPRYKNEERGSTNFVKARMKYTPDEEKLNALKRLTAEIGKT